MLQNELLCFALKSLCQMCDTEFKEPHTIFHFFWLFCCVFHTCCLLFYPRLSVCVGLAAGFSSPLRFWPLEGAVSNGKRLTVEWTLARRRWMFHYQRFTQCCCTHLRSQRDRHQLSRMYMLFWYMTFSDLLSLYACLENFIYVLLSIIYHELFDWCHLYANGSTE